MKLAKLAARLCRRRDADVQIFDATPRAVLKHLRAAAVDITRAPEEALLNFIESRAPPKQPPKRVRHHEWMLEKERT